MSDDEKPISGLESTMATILESLHEFILYYDLDMNLLYVNEAACAAAGISSEDLKTRRCWNVWNHSETPCIDCPVIAAMKTGEPCAIEKTTADGRSWIVKGYPVKDDKGIVNGAVETALEITERKKAEVELKNQANFTQSLLNAIPTPVFFKDKEGQYLGCNRAFSEVMGVSSDEIRGKTVQELWPSRHAEVYHQKDLAIINNPEHQVYEFEIHDKDGNIRPVIFAKDVFRDGEGGVAGLVGAFLDISDRKQWEKELQESEERLRHIATTVRERNAQLMTFNEKLRAEIKKRRKAERRQSAILENIPDIAWLKDRDSRFIAVNEQFALACGCSAADLVGKNDLDIWPRELAERYRADDAEVIETAKRIVVEEPLSNASGEIKWIETIKTPIFDDRGKLIGTTGIARDITERRQLEQDLIAEKERLAVTLRSIGDAVITTDRDGLILLMNPIAERLTGWSEADAVGRQLMHLLRIENEQTGEPCESPVDKVLASGQIVATSNHTVLVARDGQRYTIADSGAPILDIDGVIIGVVLVFRDITAQQRTEAELLKMEKLKSIGILAGGIAHDFNNFLTGIIGNLSLAKLDAQSGNPVSKYLADMEKAAMRAKELTQQLLTFSKGGEPIKRTADIAELVREAVQFALHGSNIGCEFDIDAELMAAEVDEGQIAQVIHNLVINADQAMPNGGKVWIQCTNVNLANGNLFVLSPGYYIQLTVQDSGIGIHPDHLKKVFDPYFTTKQKGSGLGLAVAYNIVAKHDGQVSVESKLGEGTTFTIMLPATTTGSQAYDEKNDVIVTGQGRVLVMDDEDYIRKLSVAMLTKLGYEVELAPDGQTAVDLYRQAIRDERPFDAVILDLTVPGGMGGKEAINHFIKMNKNVRAIVSSGYSNDPVMANYTRYGFCGAVKKPYMIEEMSRVLNTVIKGESGTV
jgi:PAS domain S-box-containing protein